MLYFAYGSNMSTPRLQRRIPGARFVTVAQLSEHRLRWHMHGSDDSAKCDIQHTGQAADRAHGVVFEIPDADKAILDHHEGLHHGYEHKLVDVTSTDGDTLQVLTYYAIRIDTDLQPFAWYREHVWRGAREHRLPRDYSDAIRAVPAWPDKDQARRTHELAIYDHAEA